MLPNSMCSNNVITLSQQSSQKVAVALNLLLQVILTRCFSKCNVTTHTVVTCMSSISILELRLAYKLKKIKTLLYYIQLCQKQNTQPASILWPPHLSSLNPVCCVPHTPQRQEVHHAATESHDTACL